MKSKLFELYRKAIVTTSIVIATIIVLITSPVWAFAWLTWNTSEIIKSVEEWMKKGEEENENRTD